MSTIINYIKSGIIEEYVFGLCSTEDRLEVEQRAADYPEVRAAIDDFSLVYEKSILQSSIEPDPTIKPMLLATIDYMTRLEKGEQPMSIPLLTPHSKVEDFSYWLNRSDMSLPDDIPMIYAKLIGATPEVTTAIVWLKEAAPPEVHHDTFEKFLILEGSCTIFIDKTPHNLVAGDFLSIPLHVSHMVNVTSKTPCKIILQRVAA